MKRSDTSISIRRFDPEQDFAAYVDLLDAASKHDGANDATTEQEQRDRAAMLTINLAADRLVIDHPKQPDKLAAVCDIWQISKNPSAELMLLVHPDWRRQGIGSKLLLGAIDHAKDLNATAIDAYAQPEQKGIRAFLEHHDFKVVGNYTGMEVSLLEPLPKANLPKGYSIRTYADLGGTEFEKLDLLVKAGNEFWGDLWGHKVTADAELAREVARNSVLNTHSEDAMFFLYDGNTYIGHDRVSFSETPEGIKTGYGGVPALHPDWRTPELSREFALVGLEWLYDQGCRQIALSSWGESAETIRAFEQLGFTIGYFELGYGLAF